jgi:hypothetical protein
MAAWLWPIGFGGRMPVGGDVTRFSLGLMSELQRAMRAGRLPLWNSLWGFGFPGLAESQMGVYYPPHAVLYGILPLEAAYTASLVLHTLWGAFGAWWAARRWGATPLASTLGAFAWAASGFFVIHLPHQWAATTGSWMPWAWGLAWPLACGHGRPRTAAALAAVLTLQILPGHFQLGFITQVGVLGLGLWGLIERPTGWTNAWLGAAGILAALGAVLPLGGMQLWPTFDLARLAESHRDFEYLSGFPTTPLHLVNFVAPGLFHRSPLWRPVAWNPWHAMPEEQMAYIGLVPLFLALGTIRHAWRQDPAVRALAVLAAGSLVLSLGPYVPGFRVLILLPGFSLFRAPARWGMATELALAVLAAKGLDGVTGWPRPGRSLLRFAIGAVVAVALVVAAVELAFLSTKGQTQSWVAVGYGRLLRDLPWPPERSFRQIMASAREPTLDLRHRALLTSQGTKPRDQRLDVLRFGIYRAEVAGTALGIAGLLLLRIIVRRDRLFRAGLVLLAGADLLALSRHREVELAPIRPLAHQSPVLARLAEQPYGSRSVDPLGNLAMVAGAAPVSAYRTLDRPMHGYLLRAVQRKLGGRWAPVAFAAERLAGVAVRVRDPVETETDNPNVFDAGGMGRATRLPVTRVEDPLLATWDYGPAWVQGQTLRRPSSYSFWKAPWTPTRAWFLPASHSPLADQVRRLDDRDLKRILQLFESAKPLAWRAPVPERFEVELDAEGPGIVVITQLDDPEWQGLWVGPGAAQPAQVRRVLGNRLAGWQGVDVPASGHWRLVLTYEGRAARRGLVLSGVAWPLWLLAYWWFGRRKASARGQAT